VNLSMEVLIEGYPIVLLSSNTLPPLTSSSQIPPPRRS
jgi:hypothetical protein